MAVISALAGPLVGYVLWSACSSVALAYTKRDLAELLKFPVLLLWGVVGIIFALGLGALPAAVTGGVLSIVRQRGGKQIAGTLTGFGVGGLTQAAFLFLVWRNDVALPLLEGECVKDVIVGAGSGAILWAWLPRLDALVHRCLDPPSGLGVRPADRVKPTFDLDN